MNGEIAKLITGLEINPILTDELAFQAAQLKRAGRDNLQAVIREGFHGVRESDASEFRRVFGCEQISGQLWFSIQERDGKTFELRVPYSILPDNFPLAGLGERPIKYTRFSDEWELIRSIGNTLSEVFHAGREMEQQVNVLSAWTTIREVTSGYCPTVPAGLVRIVIRSDDGINFVEEFTEASVIAGYPAVAAYRIE